MQEGLVALTPPRPGKRNSSTIRDVLRSLNRKRLGIVRSFGVQKARTLFLNLIADSMPDTLPRSVIVSEENLLGPAFERSGAGLYMSAYPRLVEFHRFLGRSPQHIHLTFRSYDTFLVSAYAMRKIYGRRVPPFDDIRERLLSFRRGWPDLVADVARAFPGSSLRLTFVEQDSMEVRVQQLVGPELFARFRLDGEELANRAPTVEAMQAAVGVRGAIARDALVARHADGTRFDPLSQDERARLSQRYDEDIGLLKSSAGNGA